VQLSGPAERPDLDAAANVFLGRELRRLRVLHDHPEMRRRMAEANPSAAAGMATRLLEATDLPIDRVAARCGLGTAANLRLHLARDADTTPTAYRRVYRGRPAPTAGPPPTR